MQVNMSTLEDTNWLKCKSLMLKEKKERVTTIIAAIIRGRV